MSEKTDNIQKLILVAEDDDISFSLLEVYLSKNFRLLRSINGEETIEMLKKHPDISLILMDLKMPIMDGYDATREIRKMNKNIPIVAQTAYALAGDNQKALDAGCDDYVTKPIKKEELIGKIERNLKN